MTGNTSNQSSASQRLRVTQEIKEAARNVGFDSCGICAAELLVPERQRYLRWIDSGRQGRMRWLTREWAMAATDPQTFLEGARSVVCVALSYDNGGPGETPPGSGRIARYAGGRDYHQVVGDKLDLLAATIDSYGAVTRPFVDTSPTMDKALAVRAGLGWQSKNTNLLSDALGSFLFLGGVITDLDLTPDAPVKDGCGSCRACSVACPTGALRGDYTIDARLCISYLTIEHREPIPRHLRSLMGDWVFGCDICQDVCPVVSSRQDRCYPEFKSHRMSYVRGLFSHRSPDDDQP